MNHKQRIVEEILLYETLTFSTSLEYATEHLNKLYANAKYNLNFYIKNGKIACKFINYKKFTDNQFSELLNSINFFGYYPSFYITYNESHTGYYHNKYNEKEVRYLATTPNTFLFYLIIEPKYDVEIDDYDLPKKLYHLTDSKNEQKILKLGLLPKTKDKLHRHPERIYFALVEDDARNLADNSFFRKDTKQFSLFELDFNKIRQRRKIRFFRDENFKDKGVYCLENIPPLYLKLLDRI